jgi:hypothetical protein
MLKGIDPKKVPGKDANLVYLQPSSERADIITLKSLYHKIGYDVVHDDQNGVFMAAPKGEYTAYEVAMRNRANAMLGENKQAGLQPNAVLKGETRSENKMVPMTAQQLLDGPE